MSFNVKPDYAKSSYKESSYKENAAARFAADYSKSDYPIIVHCHLRWDFVWQRPQQFLSRFSKKHRVLFCEGPTVHEEYSGEKNFAPFYEVRRDEKYPNVWIMASSTVLRPGATAAHSSLPK